MSKEENNNIMIIWDAKRTLLSLIKLILTKMKELYFRYWLKRKIDGAFIKTEQSVSRTYTFIYLALARRRPIYTEKLNSSIFRPYLTVKTARRLYCMLKISMIASFHRNKLTLSLKLYNLLTPMQPNIHWNYIVCPEIQNK